MNAIPLNPVPSQTLSCVINNQSTQINVYQKTTGLYLDLLLAGVLILSSRICRNLAFLINQTYQGFQGDFSFVDTLGNTDPTYMGLGSRYQLVYFAPSDFANGVGPS
jgi:hypothetical protein